MTTSPGSIPCSLNGRRLPWLNINTSFGGGDGRSNPECGQLPALPWNRGGAKSSSAELVVASAGARRVRSYVLYVSESQELADQHVGSIGSLSSPKRWSASTRRWLNGRSASSARLIWSQIRLVI